ncbi:MAG: ankyrin repeat domain-containing protein [Kiritimatiellae bacterium]|jgi:ankyrin repeat protein|nr:ankyrin repeat domain-containing protein [Kiritimatiellia bacterium]
MIAQILARKELKIILIVGGALMFISFLLRHSDRMERLARAVYDGRADAVEKILAAHPGLLNARDKSNGFTPLHWAVIAGRSNLVFSLIEKGADVNAVDRDGMTPLHRAAIFNGRSCAEALVAAGADVSAFGRKYGALRLSPLHLAAEEGHAEMIEFFLKRGVDVNLPTEGGNRITPLHMAAARGHAEAVRLLIDSGADINAADLAGKTPLTWAVVSEQQNTADLLRKAGAVP